MGSIPFDVRLWTLVLLGLPSWAHGQGSNECQIPPQARVAAADVDGGAAGSTVADIGVVCGEIGNPDN